MMSLRITLAFLAVLLVLCAATCSKDKKGSDHDGDVSTDADEADAGDAAVDDPGDPPDADAVEEAADPAWDDADRIDAEETQEEEEEASTGCGDGVCADAETAAGCPADCAPCGPLAPQGCCDGETLYRCDGGTLRVTPCGALSCGWSGSEAGYACGYTDEDPTGLYPRSCGCDLVKADTSPRVYHGTESPTAVCLSDGQILAVGALVWESGGRTSEFCTGTLVSPTVVHTAAHCLVDHGHTLVDPSTIFFAVGDDIAAPVHVFAISSVAVNPLYDRSVTYDMGVAVLAESSLDVLPSARPLPLNRAPLDPSLVGQIVQNVGYGATHITWDNTLRWWTAEEVVDLVPEEFAVYGNHWSSVCFGDSGGPSLYAFGGQAVAVIGTVSYGDASCIDYDHFSRADVNAPFLDTFIAGWDPCDGIDPVAGACEGNVRFWCEGGLLRQTCCPEACGPDATGVMSCISSEEACGGVSPLGECRGDELAWCDDGELKRRLCNVCGGGRCAWVDDASGYDCVYDP
jgi:V8-like Glu-specific endopeptidase